MKNHPKSLTKVFCLWHWLLEDILFLYYIVPPPKTLVFQKFIIFCESVFEETKWGHKYDGEIVCQNDENNSWLSLALCRIKRTLFITKSTWQDGIKSRECEDSAWAGFWVSPCDKLDFVQKFHKWYLEYFFLSANVCCDNIWPLEIILCQDSDFKQNSTYPKPSQNNQS